MYAVRVALNLHHLRIFRSILDHGSITAAAAALRISQSAVSRQLAEFEDHLGVRLVDRSPRGVRPTAAGRLLHDRARRIFSEEEAAEQEIGELLGLHGGRLAVAASTTIGNYVLPALLGEFARRHPGVTVDLEIANARSVESDVLDGRRDVGLSEGFADAEGLSADVFLHDEMILIAAPKAAGAPLGDTDEIMVARLRELPLLVRESGSGTREVVEAALAGRGVEAKPAMVLGGTEAIKNAVVHRLGVAIVSRRTVELELETGRLREVRMKDLRILRALHSLTVPGRTPSPAAAAFLALLRSGAAHS